MKIQTILRHLSREIAQILFPTSCAGCRIEGTDLCETCTAAIPRLLLGHCPYCERVSAHGATCGECLRRFGLDGVVAGTHFEDERVRESLHRAKYGRASALLKMMARLPLDVYASMPHHPMRNFNAPFLFVPVPLHPSRQRERGFNQAEIIAKEFASSLAGRVAPLLVRTRKTAPQFDLPRARRKENVRDAFALPRPIPLSGRSFVLVDDVMTTGATLHECAKVLKSSGAQSVWGMVAARAT